MRANISAVRNIFVYVSVDQFRIQEQEARVSLRRMARAPGSTGVEHSVVPIIIALHGGNVLNVRPDYDTAAHGSDRKIYFFSMSAVCTEVPRTLKAVRVMTMTALKSGSINIWLPPLPAMYHTGFIPQAVE